jgi:hypothetical protein
MVLFLGDFLLSERIYKINVFIDIQVKKLSTEFYPF